MTDIEKLKLHLKNIIEKDQQDVVVNAKWLLNILEDNNFSSNKDAVERVELDGGQF